MSDTKKYNISVVLATENVEEQANGYLPQLCAHLEECVGIDTYEVIVCDVSSGPAMCIANFPGKVRCTPRFEGETAVKTIDRAIHHAIQPYVLVLEDGILPTQNYFADTLPLFETNKHLFGMSGDTISVYDQHGDGPKFAYLSRGIVHLMESKSKSNSENATITLASHNWLCDREKYCLLGGLSSHFTSVEMAKNDLCIRAWRENMVCGYSFKAHTKKYIGALATTEAPEQLQRTNEEQFNKLLLSYLHTSGFQHAQFWIRSLMNYINAKIFHAKSKLSGLNQMKKKYKEISQQRTWYNNRIKSISLQDVIEIYFSDAGIHDIPVISDEVDQPDQQENNIPT